MLLADHVHAKGLKFGLYSDAGALTCGGRPGSAGREFQDARQYAKWGVDYLKYDLRILSNPDVIAVDQDPLGRQGQRIWQQGGLEIWARPLQGGDQAVLLLNRGTAPAEMRVTWEQLGLPPEPEGRRQRPVVEEAHPPGPWQPSRHGRTTRRGDGANQSAAMTPHSLYWPFIQRRHA
jgi:alpha galactosidase A-like protein/alpha galactosidase C-like protein